MGVSGLVGLVPTVVPGLYVGAVADEVDRRKLYLGSCRLTWIASLALMVQSLPHLPFPSGGSAGFPGLRSVADGLLFITPRPVVLMSSLVDVAAMVLAGPEASFLERRPDGSTAVWARSTPRSRSGALVAGLFGGWIGRVRRQGVAPIAAVIVWAMAMAIAAAGLTRTLCAALVLAAALAVRPFWRYRAETAG
ncbi:hypothetical protein ACQ9ZG_32635 [Streptomyces araujoniae]